MEPWNQLDAPLYLFVGLPKTGSSALYEHCFSSDDISTTKRKSTYFWIADGGNDYIKSKEPIIGVDEYLGEFQRKSNAKMYVEFCPDVVFFWDIFEKRTEELGFRPITVLITREWSEFKSSFMTQLKRSEVELKELRIDSFDPSSFHFVHGLNVDYEDTYEEIFKNSGSRSLVREILGISVSTEIKRVNTTYSLRNIIRGLIPKRIRKWLLSKVLP